MKPKHRQQAFTLIEMLIATFIFTIVSAASYSGISLLIKNQEQIAPHKQRTQQLSSVSVIFIDDMIHFINRPIIDHLDNTQAGISINNNSQTERIMEFSRKNNLLFGAQHNNSIIRVSYELAGEVLYRGVWTHLDRSAFDVDPIRTKMLDNIEKIDIKVIDQKNRVFENTFNSIQSGEPTQVLLTLTIKDRGEFAILSPL